MAAAFAIAVAGCGPSTTKSGSAATSAQNKSSAATNTAGSSKMDVLAMMPRSTFSTNAQEGRDPFFPDSARRMQQKPSAGAIAAALAQSQAVSRPLSAYLQLTGLWPAKPRPLAMINKTSIAPGEEVSIPVSVPSTVGRPEIRKVNVRCVEVRSHSVVVTVEGEAGVRELPLKTRF